MDRNGDGVRENAQGEPLRFEVLSSDDVRIIYESQSFPSTAYGYVHNLDPELAATITEAFLSFDWEGTGLKEEFSDSDQFVAIDYARDWEVLRQIDAASKELEE